jgi:cell division protein FtsA
MKNQLLSDELLVALDIGTTKICVLIAQKVADGSLSILGIGKSPSYGIARGVVVDIAQAVQSIKLAVKEAELMAGCKIESAAVGVSGAHIHALNSHGMIPVKHGRIRPFDVASVVAAAKAVVLAEGQHILHALPQYFMIDNQQKVMDPVGMFGVRLEAQVHIITGSIASVQNIVRCCQMAGIGVSDVVLEPLASADAVLSSDEKELGVALLDVGGGTSDFAIYQQGAIRHTKIFPVAGNHVTHDIALCLRTTLKDAERVKQEFGATYNSTIDLREQFEVEMVHGGECKRVTTQELFFIIEPRVNELLSMVRQEIVHHNLEHLMPAGIVLTGGGALLRGMKETTQLMLKVPARIGIPYVPHMFRESLESPLYATSYGLLVHMAKKSKGVSMEHLTGPLISRILWRMKSWVTDFF